MNTEQLIQEIRTLRPEALHKAYEAVCEVYKQRLIEQFDLDPIDVYWVGDDVGGLLDIQGTYSLHLPEIVTIVDNVMLFDDFIDWWYQWTEEGNDHPINLNSWLMGLRPDMVKPNPEVSQEGLLEAQKAFNEELDRIITDKKF